MNSQSRLPGNFRLMVAGQIVTVLGATLLRFALSLYVLDVTGRADIFAGLFAVSSVPILLAPIGGAISDRFNRQKLMVLYDVICCVLAFALFIVLLGGGASVFIVGMVMVLLGIVGAMEAPNGMSCIPLLVEESKLESANGIIQAVQSFSGIVAPILGGILYGLLGINALVGISGAAFGLAALMEMFIKIPFVKRPQASGMIETIAGDLKDGFSFVWNEPFIRKFAILAALLNVVFTPCILVAAPLVIRNLMNANDTVYGIGMGLIQFASILGALAVGLASKRMRTNNLWLSVAAIAIMIFPAALSIWLTKLGMGFWTPFTIFMFSILVMSAVSTLLSVFVIVRVQSHTPASNLGKVMAIVIAIANCAAPVGQFIYGLAFESFKGTEHIPLILAGGVSMGIAFYAGAILKNEN